MSKKKEDGAGTEKLKRKVYEKELRELQVELCRLQEWIKVSGERVIIVLEGRDAAGKGGTIKALTDRVSPRVFRVVALPAPSDRDKTQMYVQRYVVRSDDKKRARLNVIAHILAQIPYKKVERAKVKLPLRSEKRAYDDLASLGGRRYVAQKY